MQAEGTGKGVWWDFDWSQVKWELLLPGAQRPGFASGPGTEVATSPPRGEAGLGE